MDTRFSRSCCILVTHGLQDVAPGYLAQRIFFSTQRMHALRVRPLEGFGLRWVVCLRLLVENRRLMGLFFLMTMLDAMMGRVLFKWRRLRS